MIKKKSEDSVFQVAGTVYVKHIQEIHKKPFLNHALSLPWGHL